MQEVEPKGRRQEGGEATVPTHVPGADEDGDHVGLRLLRVLVLHLLQELAEAFSLLGIEGQTDSDITLSSAWPASGKLRGTQIRTHFQEANGEMGPKTKKVAVLWPSCATVGTRLQENIQQLDKGPTMSRNYSTRFNMEKMRNNLNVQS